MSASFEASKRLGSILDRARRLLDAACKPQKEEIEQAQGLNRAKPGAVVAQNLQEFELAVSSAQDALATAEEKAEGTKNKLKAALAPFEELGELYKMIQQAHQDALAAEDQNETAAREQAALQAYPNERDRQAREAQWDVEWALGQHPFKKAEDNPYASRGGY